MRILVTGGAGMVGSHCAEHFAQKKNKVIVLDNLMRSKIFASRKKSVEYNWHYLSQYKNIAFERKDIRDKSAIDKCFKKYKPDVVIHAASQPGVRYSLENPYDDYEINCLGTINVLEALRKSNPKGTLIYCSTNKVYGENINQVPIVQKKLRYAFKKISGIAEDFSIDLTGHTPYGASKLAGDLYVQEYAHVYQLKTRVFRMSCIYGTRQFGFEDHGWLAWLSLQFLRGKPISIFGDGKQVRDVLWVQDLVRAFEKSIRKKDQSLVFNIGGGAKNSLSLLELIAILKSLTKREVPIRFKKWRASDQKIYVSSLNKVKRDLKWSPTVSPRLGVQKLLQWMQTNPHLLK